MSLFLLICNAMKCTVGTVRIYLTMQVIKCGPKTLSPAATPTEQTEN
jgi:hypothetical protein